MTYHFPDDELAAERARGPVPVDPDVLREEERQRWEEKNARRAEERAPPRRSGRSLPCSAPRTRSRTTVEPPAPGAAESRDRVRRAKEEQRRRFSDEEQPGRLPVGRITTGAEALDWLKAHTTFNGGTE